MASTKSSTNTTGPSMTQRFTRSLPASRPARIALGIALIVGGLLGFLPILGFWMLPLGFVVLSVDFPTIRRARRRVQVRVMRWWRQR